MNKEQEALENLLSFAFVMSENMVGLTKGNYDEKIFIKKTYEYLNKYIGNFECRDILKSALKRLEAIENAKPSEALKDLQVIENNIIYLLSDCDTNEEVEQCLEDIKTKIPSIKQVLQRSEQYETIKLDLIECIYNEKSKK